MDVPWFRFGSFMLKTGGFGSGGEEASVNTLPFEAGASDDVLSTLGITLGPATRVPCVRSSDFMVSDSNTSGTNILCVVPSASEVRGDSGIFSFGPFSLFIVSEGFIVDVTDIPELDFGIENICAPLSDS